MLFNNAPLISDPEGTLRRRGILNGVTIRAYSSFVYTHQQVAELWDHATEGEDTTVRVVMLILDRVATFSWQYRLEEDHNQWYEGLYH